MNTATVTATQIYLNVFELSNFLANTMKQMCFKQTLEIKKDGELELSFA